MKYEIQSNAEIAAYGVHETDDVPHMSTWISLVFAKPFNVEDLTICGIPYQDVPDAYWQANDTHWFFTFPVKPGVMLEDFRHTR